jgi:hypothetical protein
MFCDDPNKTLFKIQCDAFVGSFWHIHFDATCNFMIGAGVNMASSSPCRMDGVRTGNTFLILYSSCPVVLPSNKGLVNLP